MENYEKIEKEIEILISEFEKYLINKDLSTRIINKHKSNLELLNDFLSGYDEIKLEDATRYGIESFMEWAIHKWMFNTASGVVSVLSSIKLFFSYLQEKNPNRDFKEIIALYQNKDEYVKKYIKHERLLN